MMTTVIIAPRILARLPSPRENYRRNIRAMKRNHAQMMIISEYLQQKAKGRLTKEPVVMRRVKSAAFSVNSRTKLLAPRKSEKRLVKPVRLALVKKSDFITSVATPCLRVVCNRWKGSRRLTNAPAWRTPLARMDTMVRCRRHK
jgi:hypothetical protein